MSQENVGALIRHIISAKKDLYARTVTMRKSGSYQNTAADGKVMMTETRIYIGLNDSETRKQKYDTGKYLSLLKNICRSYHVPFSVNLEEGGYFHDDGEYTEETSLVLTLIDADSETVQDIAKDLCAFFRQESVLVTENCISGQFINEAL